MIHLAFLIFAAFANITVSIPTPINCPRTKCYIATKECDMLYGGPVNLSLIGSVKPNQTWQISCWDEYGDIADRLKTFTSPLCLSSTPFSATSLWPLSPQPSYLRLFLTCSPKLGSLLSGFQGLGGPHTECTPLSICVDAMNDCGVRYGGCYDTCHQTSLTVPPCSSASSTPVSTYAIISASGGKTTSTAVSSCTGMFCRPW